jgi:uncharacterized protein (TIGR03067 family)
MFIAMILFSLTALADPHKEFSAEAKKELKKLEGKWKMVKSADAQKEFELKDEEMCFLFKDSDVTLTFSNSTKTEKLQVAAIDPATDPNCIDFLEKREGRPDRALEGVYKIDGDMLQIALSILKEGKNRPTSFEKPGDRVLIWTFKRVKE